MVEQATNDDEKWGVLAWQIFDRPAHPLRPYEVADVEMTLPDDDYLTIETELGAFGPTYLVSMDGRSLLGVVIAVGESDITKGPRFVRFRLLVQAGEIRKMAQEWVLRFGVRDLVIRWAL